MKYIKEYSYSNSNSHSYSYSNSYSHSNSNFSLLSAHRSSLFLFFLTAVSQIMDFMEHNRLPLPPSELTEVLELNSMPPRQSFPLAEATRTKRPTTPGIPTSFP